VSIQFFPTVRCNKEKFKDTDKRSDGHCSRAPIRPPDSFGHVQRIKTSLAAGFSLSLTIHLIPFPETAMTLS
jgi:hypothetical protein